MSKFVYQELHTSDPAGARKFYSEVFGWEFKDMEMSGGTYTMISADGVGIGGLVQAKSKAKSATKWVSYVGVASAKRALNKAAKRGGKVVVPVTKIPGVGAFAMIADPAGALFAVWEEAKKTAASQKAAKKTAVKKVAKKPAAKKPAAKKPATKKPAAKKPAAKKRVVKKAVTKRGAKRRVARKGGRKISRA